MRVADIRLHGEAAPRIEYFATFIGADLERRAFYEMRREGLRLFAQGNELQLAEGGVVFNGAGGLLSEYMFGSSQPVEDLLNPLVRNRLVLFGAQVDEASGRLKFTNATRGFDFYGRLFAEGNALTNLYFFVTPPPGGDAAAQQRWLLRKAGRLLKHHPELSAGDDSSLGRALHGALELPGALVCLLRVSHRGHAEYQQRLLALGDLHSEFSMSDRAELVRLSQELGIPPYLEERLRLDLIARAPDNAQLLTEYRALLALVARGGAEKPGAPADEKAVDKARTRLSALAQRAQRQGLPAGLLERYDEALRRGGIAKSPAGDTGDAARELFKRLLLTPNAQAATAADLQLLLRLKKRAHDQRDTGFEALLLETGQHLDEMTREGGDEGITPMENFMTLLALFDRFDAVEALLSQVAFAEETALDAERLRSLAGHALEFEALGAGFFEELFLRPLRANPYVLHYGRRKLNLIGSDLMKANGTGNNGLGALARTLSNALAEERLHDRVYRLAKARLKNFYFELGDPGGQEALKHAVEADLLQEEGLLDEIPPPLFERVILDIRKEAFYVNTLLPDIIKQQSTALRLDFLRNAGLDRHRVERLEAEYFDISGLDHGLLEKLQQAEA